MILCKDCKWCLPFKYLLMSDWTSAKCGHPAMPVHPVTGDPSTFCSIARIGIPDADCGPTAKKFEARQ